MDSRAEVIKLRNENNNLRNKNIELRHHYRNLCVRDVKMLGKYDKLWEENVQLRKLSRKLCVHYTHTSTKAHSAILKLRRRSTAIQSQLHQSNFLLWREKKAMAVQNLNHRAALNMLRCQIEEYKVAIAHKKVSARYKTKSFHLKARIQALQRKNKK